jgi:hypothetical protein
LWIALELEIFSTKQQWVYLPAEVGSVCPQQISIQLHVLQQQMDE